MMCLVAGRIAQPVGTCLRNNGCRKRGRCFFLNCIKSFAFACISGISITPTSIQSILSIQTGWSMGEAAPALENTISEHEHRSKQ